MKLTKTKNHYAEYRWNKEGGYELIVGHYYNNIVITDYRNTYATKLGAKRAFKRQVKKIENGEY